MEKIRLFEIKTVDSHTVTYLVTQAHITLFLRFLTPFQKIGSIFNVVKVNDVN